MEQGGHILGQPRTAIGDRDPQLPDAVRRSDGDETAIRRGGTRIQQQIEEYNVLSQQVMQLKEAVSESVEKVRASAD